MARQIDSWVTLKVAKVEAVSPKAILVHLEDGQEVWLPKSQLQDADSFVKGAENLEIQASEWIAGEKGLIGA